VIASNRFAKLKPSAQRRAAIRIAVDSEFRLSFAFS
jgi:hypothetical protein